jgi:antitoxin component of RelBE/YafQ-DinJ toxin-antitoxin module
MHAGFIRGEIAAMTDQDNSNRPLSPNRRQILGGLGAAGALGGLGLSLGTSTSAQAAEPEIDQTVDLFLQASARITGIPLDRSYVELAETIFAALTESKHPRRTIDKVTQTVLSSGQDWHQALTRQNLITPAQDIALIWYTGMTDYRPNDTSTSTVITYDNALAWRACSFTKPPANCGGPFGYWYDPA